VELRLPRNRNRYILRRTDLPRADKAGRRYAHDGKRAVVEIDLFADDRRVVAETLLPVTIVQHPDRRGRKVVIVIRQKTPQQWLHAQPAVVIARDELPANNIRLPIGQRVQTDSTEREDVRQRALLA